MTRNAKSGGRINATTVKLFSSSSATTLRSHIAYYTAVTARPAHAPRQELEILRGHKNGRCQTIEASEKAVNARSRR